MDGFDGSDLGMVDERHNLRASFLVRPVPRIIAGDPIVFNVRSPRPGAEFFGTRQRRGAYWSGYVIFPSFLPEPAVLALPLNPNAINPFVFNLLSSPLLYVKCFQTLVLHPLP